MGPRSVAFNRALVSLAASEDQRRGFRTRIAASSSYHRDPRAVIGEQTMLKDNLQAAGAIPDRDGVGSGRMDGQRGRKGRRRHTGACVEQNERSPLLTSRLFPPNNVGCSANIFKKIHKVFIKPWHRGWDVSQWIEWGHPVQSLGFHPRHCMERGMVVHICDP